MPRGSGKAKVANDRIIGRALKSFRGAQKFKAVKKPVRFFIIAKFDSNCFQCNERVITGEKAMFRPRQGMLPKLFLCMKCAQPWLADAVITIEPAPVQEPVKPISPEQEAKYQEWDKLLGVTGSKIVEHKTRKQYPPRDPAYKKLDEIYDSP